MPRPDITSWSGPLFKRQMRAVLDYLDGLGGGGGGSVDWGAIGGNIEDQADLVAELAAIGGASFESVSKNLASVGGSPIYFGGEMIAIGYTNGITKEFGYDANGRVTTITLSGATPGGISLVKTITYVGDDLGPFSYS